MDRKSQFQFTRPELKSISFRINGKFDNAEKEREIEANISVDVNKHKEKPYAHVELTVSIGTQKNNDPYTIQATEMSDFRWDETVDDDASDRFLNVNAPSFLLSYLRPIIASITSSSSYGTYNIPMINFTRN